MQPSQLPKSHRHLDAERLEEGRQLAVELDADGGDLRESEAGELALSWSAVNHARPLVSSQMTVCRCA
jgi:hypothetical protein